MKNFKLVIGIVSMVSFGLIVFQSCAVGLGEALSGSDAQSGAAGFIFAFVFLIAGILAVATRNSERPGYASGIFYLLGALIGGTAKGQYADGDLSFWAVIAGVFGTIIVIHAFVTRRKLKRMLVMTQTEGQKTAAKENERPLNMSTTTESPGENRIVKLRELKGLLDEGILSEEEYQKEKGKVLS